MNIRRFFTQTCTDKYFIRLVLLITFLTFFSKVSLYLLFSFLLSLSLSPLYHFFFKLKIGRFSFSKSLASITTLVVFIVIFLGVITFFMPLFSSQYETFSQIDWVAMEQKIEPIFRSLTDDLKAYGILDTKGETLEQYMLNRFSKFLEWVDLTGLVNTLLSTFGDLLIGALAVCFISFFFLKDGRMMESLLFRFFVPPSYFLKGKKFTLGLREVLIRYLTGILFQVSAITLIISLGLFFLNIPTAFAMGAMVGLLNIIPYVGPLIGGGLVVLMTLLHEISIAGLSLGLGTTFLKVASVILLAQLLDNILIQPTIFSKSTKLHPLEVFLIVLCGASLAGIAGMVVAVPFYSVLKMGVQVFQNRVE